MQGLATHARTSRPLPLRSYAWLLFAPSLLLAAMPALVLWSTGREIEPQVRAMGAMLAALPMATPLMLRLA